MDGQYIVFAIICGRAMAVWAKLDFCGEGKCRFKSIAGRGYFPARQQNIARPGKSKPVGNQ
jgi:hypothetical protein